MRTPRLLLVLSTVGVLAAGGLALSSNMGLMARIDLSPGQDIWLGLPYSTELETAQDLCERIGPSASLVSYFDTDAQARLDWACPAGTNFELTPGQGLFVRVSAPGQVLLLGAHDPLLEVPVGGFAHANRDYYLSVPYHTSAAVADDLCEQIPNASVVSRFERSLGAVQDWTCPLGNNFPIQIGEALRVRVSAPGPGFLPEHF